jgi:hypothetical protein
MGSIYKDFEPPKTQGPQKKFGRPHVARGPQFGHVCYIHLDFLVSHLKLRPGRAGVLTLSTASPKLGQALLA